MKKHKGIIRAAMVGCFIVFMIIYMVSGLRSNKSSDIIYFVSKTSSQNSTFWHSVERGVNVAADELGLQVVFVGPKKEIDLVDQIQMVKDGIAEDPMAIILASSDYNVLKDVSQEVIENGITFVTVDSDVNIDSEHSFIATDNIEAARQLGEIMAKEIDGAGRVCIISHLEGTTSAIDRIDGFKEAIEAYENIKLVEEIPYSDNEASIAFEETKAMIEKYPDIVGIFGTNEATLIGIAKAVDELDKKDQITVVGFDISEAAAGYLENNVIHTIVIQRPFNMGYLSVKEAYEQAKSGRVSQTIDVDIVLVTKENMFDEDIQKFLIPFLE